MSVSMNGTRPEVGVPNHRTNRTRRTNGPRESPTDPMRLAREYLKAHGRDHAGRLILRSWNAEWWRFGAGAYHLVPDEEFKPQLLSFLCNHFSARDIKDTSGFRERVPDSLLNMVDLALKAQASVLIPKDVQIGSWLGARSANNHRYVSMQNGLLDLGTSGDPRQTIRLLGHNPDWFSTVRLPYSFDPQAECPQWLAFLQRVFDSDPQRMDFVQEFCGYCLDVDTSMHVFLMLVGSGANGKSVFLSVLESLVGSDNCSAVALEDFSNDFIVSRTVGKAVNIVSEIGDVRRLPEGKLKAFVAGERMTFNRKYRDPFEAVATAKLICATNRVPKFADRSDGLWRRLLILPFNVTIPEGERDRTLTAKLRLELPGILNWALKGRRRLYERGHFVAPAIVKEMVAAHRLDGNAERRFLSECCSVIDGEQTVKADVYRAYCVWCQDNGEQPVTAAELGKEVKAIYGDEIDDARPQVDGNRRPVYINLKLLVSLLP